MAIKKIPRAIRVDYLEQLKKIDPDINKSIGILLNKKEPEKPKEQPEVEPNQIMADRLWQFLKPKVQHTVDQAIYDAKSGKY